MTQWIKKWPLFLPTIAILSLAGDGSNLGGPAVFYQPPVLIGNVTFSSGQADGVRVGTRSGQRTRSDQVGDYELTVDAPGMYDLVAQQGLNRAVTTVEAFVGQSVAVNLDLGERCVIDPWPQGATLVSMISCINGNQTARSKSRGGQ